MIGLEAVQEQMRGCTLCLERGFTIVPGAVFSGRIGAQVMVIGQAPGITESETGRPFNAGSGTRLFAWLTEAGWQEEAFRATHYMTAITKCYPGKSNGGKGDRLPSVSEQKLCRPYLTDELSYVKPCLILLVGSLSIRHFFPKKLRLNEIIGRVAHVEDCDAVSIPFDGSMLDIYEQLDGRPSGNGIWFVPLPHPSGASTWLNQQKHKILLKKAIKHIATLRVELNLA